MEKFCQSCGMPMGDTNELFGTEKNGEKSADYCKYCYENGEHTFHAEVVTIDFFHIKLALAIAVLRAGEMPSFFLVHRRGGCKRELMGENRLVPTFLMNNSG